MCIKEEWHLGGWQGNHVEKDVEESPRGSGPGETENGPVTCLIVDKVLLSAAVRLSRSFFDDDSGNGTAAEKIQFVFRHITALTAWPHHHTRTVVWCNGRTSCRKACRSAPAV